MDYITDSKKTNMNSGSETIGNRIDAQLAEIEYELIANPNKRTAEELAIIAKRAASLYEVCQTLGTEIAKSNSPQGPKPGLM